MLQEGQVVEVVTPMSVGFVIGTFAIVREITERGDFILEHLSADVVPAECTRREKFGFAYQSHLRVLKEVGESRDLKALGSGTSGFGEETEDYNPDLLEAFENKHPEKAYWVRLICGEFTSLCPKTGQADWAEIVINYIPDKRCVESKSLKLYLHSFRNHGDFHEDVVNVIADDLVKLMSPRYLEVCGRFNPRGGIAIYPYVVRCREGDFEWVKFAENRGLSFPIIPGRGPQLR